MTQETEKEDPRQVPPKQFASDRPGDEQSTKTPDTGGLRDDIADAGGAVDDEQGAEKDSARASGSGGASAPGTQPASSGGSGSSGSGKKR